MNKEHEKEICVKMESGPDQNNCDLTSMLGFSICMHYCHQIHHKSPTLELTRGINNVDDISDKQCCACEGTKWM